MATMTDEQFNKEVAELRALGDELVAEINAVDEGATDEQVKASAPRPKAEVTDFVAKHAEKAAQDSLAEAKFLAGEAMKIMALLAKAGASGGAAGALG
jgi:primosomal protein N''